jgi:hypothetical protein
MSTQQESNLVLTIKRVSEKYEASRRTFGFAAVAIQKLSITHCASVDALFCVCELDVCDVQNFPATGGEASTGSKLNQNNERRMVKTMNEDNKI